MKGMICMQLTFQGEPIDFKGQPAQVGDSVPEAKLVNLAGEDVLLSEVLGGQVTIISVVPNVETRTCELQTQNFDQLTQDKGVQFITVSRNSVEEFTRWNQDHDLSVASYSDAYGEFGQAFDLELELFGSVVLTRSVYVVDTEGVIRYVEVVEEVANEPEYDSALAAAEEL